MLRKAASTSIAAAVAAATLSLGCHSAAVAIERGPAQAPSAGLYASDGVDLLQLNQCDVEAARSAPAMIAFISGAPTLLAVAPATVLTVIVEAAGDDAALFNLVAPPLVVPDQPDPPYDLVEIGPTEVSPGSGRASLTFQLSPGMYAYLGRRMDAGGQVAPYSGGPCFLFEIAGEHMRFVAGDPTPRPYLTAYTEAVFSPDGTRVLMSSGDRALRIWDAATGALVLEGFESDHVVGAAFSPDSRFVATAIDAGTSAPGGAGLWDTAAQQRVATFDDPGGRITGVSFFPDNRRLLTVSSFEGFARIWDISSGALLATLQGPRGMLTEIAISPDSQLVVAGFTSGTALVWDAASGAIVAELDHDDSVNDVAFSPDGTIILSASRDQTGALWSAATGERLAILAGHTGFLTTGAFSTDGARVVTGATDRTARVWSVSGELLAVLEGHTATLTSVGFSPDGASVVTTARESTTRIWEASTGAATKDLPSSRDWIEILSASYSPDGRFILTAGNDGIARSWLAP